VATNEIIPVSRIKKFDAKLVAETSRCANLVLICALLLQKRKISGTGIGNGCPLIAHPISSSSLNFLKIKLILFFCGNKNYTTPKMKNYCDVKRFLNIEYIALF